MNDYSIILENVLFEFNWGQENPVNHIQDATKWPLVLQTIAGSGCIENHIARYHNWINRVHVTLGGQAAAKLAEADTVKYREAALNALHGRLLLEQPKHPAIIIYNSDCQLYKQQQQDSI